MNTNGKRHYVRDAPQSLDHIVRADGSEDVERLSASGMCDHKEDAGETCHVVGVHMCQADGSQLSKAPPD